MTNRRPSLLAVAVACGLASAFLFGMRQGIEPLPSPRPTRAAAVETVVVRQTIVVTATPTPWTYRTPKPTHTPAPYVSPVPTKLPTSVMGAQSQWGRERVGEEAQ